MRIRLSIALACAVTLAAAAADFKPFAIKTGELKVVGANAGSTTPPGAPAVPKKEKKGKKEKPGVAGGKEEPSPGLPDTANFTFTVPLAIENVPSATSAVVFCTVSRGTLGGVFPFAARNIVGNGSTAQPLKGGAFSGFVRVTVNADKTIPASTARSYSCNISLNGRSTAGVAYIASFANMADAVSRAAGQTLTMTHTLVSGVIPERP
jgi:hypothetical protein